MFRAYPGFENLPLRVEVQWRGATRSVVARLEQWPDSDKAVLVCSFEDDIANTERIVTQGKSFYSDNSINHANAFLRQQAHKTSPTQVHRGSKWRKQIEEKARTIVRFAYTENNSKHGLARVLLLPNLSQTPRCVWDSAEGLLWCAKVPGTESSNFVPFSLPSEQLPLDQFQAVETLEHFWNLESSDVRFSWNWSRLSNAEANNLLMGVTGDLRELERVMRLVLISTSKLWESSNRWKWKLTPYKFSDDGFSNHTSSFDGETLSSRKWQKFLRSRYAPNWRGNLIERHKCALNFYSSSRSFYLGIVEVGQPPIAHEQLEAKLQLRDWLQDKATPAEIEQLLAT